ncbi:Transposase IS200 like protein [compost metagenome]
MAYERHYQRRGKPNEFLPGIPPPIWDDGSLWTRTQTSTGSIVFENTGEEVPTPKASASEVDELEFLRHRLEEEIKAKWELQRRVLDGAATARFTGRVARIDAKSEEAKTRTVWLAVEDEDGYQAIRLTAEAADLSYISGGERVTIACRWRRGHLVLWEIESCEDVEEPLPEVKLPEPKGKADDVGKDGKLPTMDELDAEARKGGWGALNHSVYRCPIAWHLTTSPKGRAKAFDGRAVEVQAILREVAEAEGLTVIACAAEGDHIHLLGLPSGKGGMPPTWVWSRWIGRWKSLTSRRLKSLPGLEAFEWQTGYALTSVAGGKQGAEEALEIVKRYVDAQGDQGYDIYQKGGESNGEQ